MKIAGLHHRVFSLLMIAALLLAGMPAVVPASCSPAGCSHSCCDPSSETTRGADESNGCCSHHADNTSDKSDHHESGSTCSCAGLCSTSACPVYADFGTYIPIPLLQAHLLPASLNPSDYISEEPQPPHVLG